jgi:signal transduction histidine kinase
MGFAATVTLGLAVFAFATATFNLWVFWMRPRAPAHLWLGVASIGVVWLAVGLSASYGARSLAEAQNALLLALGGALPLTAGFIRFSELFADIRHPLLRAGIPYTAIVTGVTYAKPTLFFDGTVRSVATPFGSIAPYAGLTSVAAAAYLGFGALIAALVVGYARRARQIEGGQVITGALALWGACMINDMCVGVALYAGPWLLPLGFVAFGGAFSSLLLRSLVRSQLHVERNAGELHALVDARTDELRRKDLELAHGARLATLGALAGGIAHEVEEPLAAIDAGMKELRSAWRDASRPHAFKELLVESQRNVERIRRVVAELLQLARRDEGRRGVHELPLIVAGVLPIAGYELRRRARIETHLAAAPPVSGDAAMLSQIALNLLVGAIHAFPAAPRSDSALIHVATEERSGRARLVVTDNSPTLPNEVATDLFELAGASDSERERRVQLAVTKQLVERHGGSIQIDSGAGGTTIAVEFPAAGAVVTPP